MATVIAKSNYMYLKSSVVGTLLCLSFLLAPALQAATYYISPSGSDSNSCSSTSPCKTFSRLFGSAQPGDTLILKNGTYSGATGTGFFNANCSAGTVRNGTSSSPITIKAENERQAFIKGDGNQIPFYMANCSYWNVIGLHVENADFNGSSEGDVMEFDNSSNITVQRNILAKPNRYFNSHALLLYNSNKFTIVENEIYYAHRHGIILYRSDGNYVARNYLNKRGYGPLVSVGGGGGGSTGITCYPCSNSVIANNIAENWLTTSLGPGSGYDTQAIADVSGDSWLGNIALNVSYGFLFNARGTASDGSEQPRHIRIINGAVINAGVYNFYLRSPYDIQCQSCTGIGATSTQALFASDLDSPAGVSPYSLNVSNSLMISGSNAYGFFVAAGTGWSGTFDHNNAYGNAIDLSLGSQLTSTSKTQTNPGLGACKIFIPDGSPMKGAGASGADIGANVLYQYDSTGALTTTKLWNNSTGAFLAAGARVTGLNDVAGSSLFDVQNRLNVNQNGCSLPVAYLSTVSTVSAPLAPTNLLVRQ